VQPDTISYTSVIQAWSQSGSAEAPERAQALLDDMEKSYRSQQQQQPQEQSNDTATRCKLQPDVRLYATIMNLFAKSRRPEQAQALYDKLRIAPTRTTLAQTFLDPSRFNTFQLAVGCLGQSGKWSTRRTVAAESRQRFVGLFTRHCLV
jgi:hypothetical protein